jgi:hypothetical protein
VYWLLGLAGFAVLVVAGTGWYRNWSVFGRPAQRRSRKAVVIGVVASLVALTEAFAAAAAVACTFGLTHARPALHHASDYLKLEAFYAWYMLNSIPQIDAANTLQWHRSVTLPGTANGALLLAYKLLVLVPVIYAIVKLLKGMDTIEGGTS